MGSADWRIWRVVSSSHFSETLREVSHNWTLPELVDAHEVLDVIAELEGVTAE